MDTQAAIRVAKEYIRQVFAEEGAQDIGLEELERDEVTGDWRVTIGFSRPWETTTRGGLLQLPRWPIRTYKIVGVRERDAAVTFLRHRELAVA